MLHGLPGSGKSTIAEKLSSYIKNSVVLKTVSMRPVHGNGVELFDENNLTTREDKDVSYRALCDAARKAVKEGKSPILDATFHKKYRRQWVYDLGKELHEKVIVISTECNEKVVFERLKNRKGKQDEDSFLQSKKAYEIMKNQQDALTEITPIRVDTTQHFDVHAVIKQAKTL